MMKRSEYSGSFWSAFKWALNLGVFNIAIYGKIVQCSFKSFEQCIYVYTGKYFLFTYTIQARVLPGLPISSKIVTNHITP